MRVDGTDFAWSYNLNVAHGKSIANDRCRLRFTELYTIRRIAFVDNISVDYEHY